MIPEVLYFTVVGVTGECSTDLIGQTVALVYAAGSYGGTLSMPCGDLVIGLTCSVWPSFNLTFNGGGATCTISLTDSPVYVEDDCGGTGFFDCCDGPFGGLLEFVISEVSP
jgi:hypothetical protein